MLDGKASTVAHGCNGSGKRRQMRITLSDEEVKALKLLCVVGGALFVGVVGYALICVVLALGGGR
jgi:hypothetical protein